MFGDDFMLRCKIVCLVRIEPNCENPNYFWHNEDDKGAACCLKLYADHEYHKYKNSIRSTI